MQAGQKSGASITAYCALEQGREVFAVPGRVDDPLSAGCHALLRQGAVLMRNATDVLEEFGYTVQQKAQQQSVQMEISSVVAEQEAEAEDGLLVHCRQPISIDELIEKTGLALSEMYQRLNTLQLEGRVEQNFMGLWQKI